MTREFGTLPLRKLTTYAVEQYQSKLLKNGKKPATVNRYVAVLKHMVTKAHEWNMVPDAILSQMRRVKQLPVDNVRLRYLSEEECIRLLDACDDHLRPVVETALNTGMRQGEILALKWRHVNFARSCIHVELAWKDRKKLGKPKWEKNRVSPLPGSLIPALLLIRGLQKEVYDEDLVFCYPDGKRLGGTWWQQHFRKGMDACGIDYEKRNLKPHSFRHTLNTLLRERSYDADKIRASMGWSSTDVQ